MTTVPVLDDPDGPAWLACARCGHTAARIDAFLAHVRECQGAWEVREVLAEAEAPILAQAPAAPPQALAVVPAAEPAPEPRPVLAADPRPKPAAPKRRKRRGPTQAERWASVRDRYFAGATLSQIAREEGVTPGAVRLWRDAAVMAGTEEDRDWRAFGQEKRRGKATPTRRLTNDSRRPTKTKAAPRTSLEETKPAAAAPVLMPAPVSISAPPGAVPRLGLSSGQAEIAQALYEGRVLLWHPDEKAAWWADAGRGRPVSEIALATLVKRGLVAPYGWDTSAPVRRLLLTDEGRLLAGQIEFALGLAQEA